MVCQSHRVETNTNLSESPLHVDSMWHKLTSKVSGLDRIVRNEEAAHWTTYWLLLDSIIYTNSLRDQHCWCRTCRI